MLTQFEHRLREDFGLNVAALGAAWLERAVRLRLKSLSLAHLDDYERCLEDSPAEWAELLESLLVRETWFFREPEAITALVRTVLNDWLPAHPAAPAQLLSVPCASGEEPFSLVMALLDGGVKPMRFAVDAADLSTTALARARLGIYGRNSFRHTNLAFRDRHFTQTPEGFLLDPAVRARVHFAQANLLSDDFQAENGPYDFVFCRNLLIYLDEAGQRRALSKLERLLAPKGLLFLAAAEQSLALEHGFLRAGPDVAFACRRPNPSAAAPRAPEFSAAAARPLSIPASRWPAHPPAVPVPAASSWLQFAPPDSAASAPSSLEQVRVLADAGRLAEAAALCEAHLRESRTSAQGYYLLGLVREAGGDARAIDCYRKALYLQPDHYETLLQMALLAGKNGDAAAARNFRRRAQRSRTYSNGA